MDMKKIIRDFFDCNTGRKIPFRDLKKGQHVDISEDGKSVGRFVVTRAPYKNRTTNGVLTVDVRFA